LPWFRRADYVLPSTTLCPLRESADIVIDIASSTKRSGTDRIVIVVAAGLAD